MPCKHQNAKLLWQAEWREEVKKHFEKIKSEGTCIHRLDEELIRRRREELRFVGFMSGHKIDNWLQSRTGLVWTFLFTWGQSDASGKIPDKAIDRYIL